ncbi:MAG: molecular chaperone HtpG [Gammaproteobacteria bacterium RIFCSPHIGHO2_02_FULL_42_13]|nr:MAG: molecular chaperone HtpG [Gammaproteobacteria bacterium RIFCSPHIGHO2_02_FULL_42_13]
MTAETRQFSTEINKLLHLMIHSLYSSKEIFLRELISNSADAFDRARILAMSNPGLFTDNAEQKIFVDVDKKARTITVRDNGIGMTHEEVIANLGTIAKSGTEEFFKKLSDEQAKDANLIGQFGVGFYSVFMVADKVIVFTRHAEAKPEAGVRWESNGQGEYTIEAAARKTLGTEVILHLKKDADEFLEDYRLRGIIKQYSDHITVPIFMQKIEFDEKGQDKKSDKIDWEQVNKATALWTLPKSKIKDEEYKELYKNISHDFSDPILWSHNKVEGKLEYTSLLYIPSTAPFDLWQQTSKHRGLKLYVKRVFILDDAEQFLPTYLRFVKGVVDCNDLPLNVSREILQHNPTVDKIRAALTKRILNMLEEVVKTDADKYAKIWAEFGKVLKEGLAEDFANKDQIAKLMRFASTHTDNEKQDVSLSDYVSRMKLDQDVIYCVTADTFLAAKNSPHLEVFRQKGIEVLLFSDRIDEWVLMHLTEFEGKKLQSITKGDLDLSKFESPETKEAREKKKEDFDNLLKQVTNVLGEKVKEVRLTYRLTTSPACIVADSNDVNMNMQRILKSLGQAMPESKPIFELNPEHGLVKRLNAETDDARFAEWTQILFDQSVLAEGGQLEDPATFVKHLNALLFDLSKN